jgi:hypothetical protein
MNVCNEGGSFILFHDQLADPVAADRTAVDPKWGDYYRARERMELAAAEQAHSTAARRVHQELAQAYARLAKKAVRR